MLSRYLVLGISVLAASQDEAERLAKVTSPYVGHAAHVLRMSLPAPKARAHAEDGAPPTLRSGSCKTPSGRPIMVEVV